jgi:hypothetical protein
MGEVKEREEVLFKNIPDLFNDDMSFFFFLLKCNGFAALPTFPVPRYFL